MFRILAKFLREFISVRIHVAPVFAPARMQEKIPGELFMYWFRARGYALLLAEGSLYTTNLSRSTAPMSIAMLLHFAEVLGSEVAGTLPRKDAENATHRFSGWHVCRTKQSQKNPRAHKIKIGTSPPPPQNPKYPPP